MIGSAPDSARRKPSHGSANDEVRDGGTVVKNTKRSADAFTEKRKKKEHLCSSNHGKGRDIRNGDQRIKKSRVPAALCEKGREKDGLNKTNSKKMVGVDLDKKRRLHRMTTVRLRVRKRSTPHPLRRRGRKNFPMPAQGRIREGMMAREGGL